MELVELYREGTQEKRQINKQKKGKPTTKVEPKLIAVKEAARETESETRTRLL